GRRRREQLPRPVVPERRDVDAVVARRGRPRQRPALLRDLVPQRLDDVLSAGDGERDERLLHRLVGPGRTDDRARTPRGGRVRFDATCRAGLAARARDASARPARTHTREIPRAPSRARTARHTTTVVVPRSWRVARRARSEEESDARARAHLRVVRSPGA